MKRITEVREQVHAGVHGRTFIRCARRGARQVHAIRICARQRLHGVVHAGCTRLSAPGVHVLPLSLQGAERAPATQTTTTT